MMKVLGPRHLLLIELVSISHLLGAVRGFESYSS